MGVEQFSSSCPSSPSGASSGSSKEASHKAVTQVGPVGSLTDQKTGGISNLGLSHTSFGLPGATIASSLALGTESARLKGMQS